MGAMRHAPTHHRFGANYTPSKRWYAMWNDFRADEIEADFAAIRALGLDHIRLQAIWPWFHVLPNWVSPEHLQRLEQVLELAEKHQLDVSLAAFTGWLSGYAFLPPFIERAGFFTDAKQRRAQERYLRELASVASGRSNLIGFDLGNEMDVVWRGDTLEEGDAWMAWALGLCRELDPEGLHVNGVDHNPYFRPFGFSPTALGRLNPVQILHVYTYWSGADARYPANHRLRTQLPTFLARLARAHAANAAAPVWLQEFGSAPWAQPEAEIPEMLEAVVRAGVTEGIAWFTWWSSHDVPVEMDFHEFEYGLGLIDGENRPKPQGTRMAAMVAEYAGRPVILPTHAAVAPPDHDPDSVWEWLEAQSGA